MAEIPPFEIPGNVRELAERNVEHARAAYAQFLEMARRAQDLVSKSQGAITAGAIEIQSKALSYAEKNIEDSFDFAESLARARDLQQYVEIQQRFAQQQMQAYAAQAQELGQMIAQVAQKAQPKT